MTVTTETVLGWDEWRALYDTATLGQQKLWHCDFAAVYPDQRHFNEAAVSLFLEAVMPRTVVEVGGYDGALADLMLGTMISIGSWTNLDLAETVRPVCLDRRYRVPPLDVFPWETELAADALVLSHVIEHLRWVHARALLERFTGRAVYIDSPIGDEDGATWEGFTGTHILEVGWETLAAAVAGLGFRELGRCPSTYDGQARWWSR